MSNQQLISKNLLARKNDRAKVFLSVIVAVVVSTFVSVGVTYWILNQENLTEKLSSENLIQESLDPADSSVSEEDSKSVARVTKGSTKALHELNEALVSVAEAVKPSIVTVFTEKIQRIQRNPFGFSPFFNDPFFQQFFRGFEGQNPRGRGGPVPEQPYEERRSQGLGSGVIVSADGFILTNNHVIAEADEIRVRTLTNELLDAKVIGADPKTDIAVIKVEAKNLRAIAQGDSDQLRVGEIVLAVGSPMSANLNHTVTQGIVSAKGRSNVGLAEYEDFIQTDADINPGNSGGALVNLDGSLVGINTAIVTRSGGSQGIGFSVPVNMARAVMDSLIKNGKVVRSWLGVQVQDLTPELSEAMGLKDTNAVLVAAVQDGSPAQKAGLQAGDAILLLDSQKVETASELRNRISVKAPGSTVKLKIKRDSKELDLTVKLELMPADGAEGEEPNSSEPVQGNELLGFEVAALTDSLRQQFQLPADLKGVVVIDISQNSAAFSAGVRQGDLIQSVNKKPVSNTQEFVAATKDLKKGSTILLKLGRRGGTLFLAFSLRG